MLTTSAVMRSSMLLSVTASSAACCGRRASWRGSQRLTRLSPSRKRIQRLASASISRSSMDGLCCRQRMFRRSSVRTAVSVRTTWRLSETISSAASAATTSTTSSRRRRRRFFARVCGQIMWTAISTSTSCREPSAHPHPAGCFFHRARCRRICWHPCRAYPGR